MIWWEYASVCAFLTISNFNIAQAERKLTTNQFISIQKIWKCVLQFCGIACYGNENVTITTLVYLFISFCGYMPHTFVLLLNRIILTFYAPHFITCLYFLYVQCSSRFRNSICFMQCLLNMIWYFFKCSCNWIRKKVYLFFN